MPLFIRMERPFWGLISLRNKQYWQSRSTITALLLAVLFISGHLIANAGYDADGGKHLTGFYFFSPLNFQVKCNDDNEFLIVV